eukprot:3403088-Ditylum_brightwellii.AAC.1
MQTGRGGAVSVIGSSISMNNCTIINNTAFESANTPVPSIGGGIYIDSSSKCNVSYTSFRGNNAGGFGDDVCSINSGLARKNPSSMFIDTSTSDANTANGKVTLSIVSSTFEIEQNNQETSRDLQRKNNEEEQRSGDDIVSLIDGQDSVDGDVVLSSASLHIIEEKEFYSGKLQSYFSLWSKNASLFFNSSTNGDSKARLRSLVMINSNLTSLLKGIIVEADATLIDVILSSLEDSYISEFEVLGKTDIGDSANKEPGGRFNLVNIQMIISGVMQTNGVSFSLQGKESAIIVSKRGSMILSAPTLFQKIDYRRSILFSSSKDMLIVNNGLILHKDCGSFLTTSGGVVSQNVTGVTRIELCDIEKWPVPMWNINTWT